MEHENLDNEAYYPRSYSSTDLIHDRGTLTLDEDNTTTKRRTKGKLILRSFKKKKLKFQTNAKKVFDILTTKEFNDNDLKAIFNGDTVIKNIKTRRKELKTNDTIVAVISLIMIILCFYQVSM
jgi:hypothetical protein